MDTGEVPRLERGGRQEKILHVRRDDLRPDVREYTDNLGAQVAVALRELGVKDIAGYEKLVRERRIPEAKVRAFKELMAQFAEAVKKNMVPEGTEDAEEREYHKHIVDYIERAVAAGTNVKIAVESVAGIDTEEAWKLREMAFAELQKDNFSHASAFIVGSLAGLDNERSWELRELLRPYTSLVESLIGLDSERSWNERENILKGRLPYDQKQHVDPQTHFLPSTLAGMDSLRAWELRDRLAKIPGMTNRWTLVGLAGLNSARSWDERDKLTSSAASFDIDSFAKSVMSLDDSRAWDMREKFLLKLRNQGPMAASLIGLNSERAEEMRERLFYRLQNLPGLLGLSMIGVHSRRAWEIRESLFNSCVRNPHEIRELLGDHIYAGMRAAQRREQRQRILGI